MSGDEFNAFLQARAEPQVNTYQLRVHLDDHDDVELHGDPASLQVGASVRHFAAGPYRLRINGGPSVDVDAVKVVIKGAVTESTCSCSDGSVLVLVQTKVELESFIKPALALPMTQPDLAFEGRVVTSKMQSMSADAFNAVLRARESWDFTGYDHEVVLRADDTLEYGQPLERLRVAGVWIAQYRNTVRLNGGPWLDVDSVFEWADSARADVICTCSVGGKVIFLKPIAPSQQLAAFTNPKLAEPIEPTDPPNQVTQPDLAFETKPLNAEEFNAWLRSDGSGNVRVNLSADDVLVHEGPVIVRGASGVNYYESLSRLYVNGGRFLDVVRAEMVQYNSIVELTCHDPYGSVVVFVKALAKGTPAASQRAETTEAVGELLDSLAEITARARVRSESAAPDLAAFTNPKLAEPVEPPDPLSVDEVLALRQVLQDAGSYLRSAYGPSNGWGAVPEQRAKAHEVARLAIEKLDAQRRGVSE